VSASSNRVDWLWYPNDPSRRRAGEKWETRSVFQGGLSEARKFGVSVVAANQFLDQYPSEMRAAVLSVGTHIFFQLSSADAGTVAQMLDGGKSLAEKLKNLPQRRFIVSPEPNTGARRWFPPWTTHE
jgi:hypothetical protein